MKGSSRRNCKGSQGEAVPTVRAASMKGSSSENCKRGTRAQSRWVDRLSEGQLPKELPGVSTSSTGSGSRSLNEGQFPKELQAVSARRFVKSSRMPQ